MITNTDITLFTKRLDKVKRADVYERTYISGVWRHSRTTVTYLATGSHSSDEMRLRIPVDADTEGKAYLPPEEYKLHIDVMGYWTLQPDDIIVIGRVTSDISSQRDLAEEYDEVYKITSIADNRIGTQPHWKVGAI